MTIDKFANYFIILLHIFKTLNVIYLKASGIYVSVSWTLLWVRFGRVFFIMSGAVPCKSFFVKFNDNLWALLVGNTSRH